MQLKQIRKSLWALLMITMLTSMTVMASDPTADRYVPDTKNVLVAEESKTLGSITINLEDSEHKRPKENVVFNVTKVADVIDGEFVLEEKYADLGLDLNDIQNANELEMVCEALEPVAGNGIQAVTDKEGIAIADELPVGVYFIHAVDIAEYEYITSFLVSIPTWNEVEKKMDYDITAIPKHTEIIGTITTDTPGDFSEGVKTGDLSNYVSWIYVAVISAIIALSILLHYLYKKNKTSV